MRILLCCEFFHPSVGGVQEVMKQLAERFVSEGNEVVVATSAIEGRDSLLFRGVRIEPFEISGNLVKGFEGGDLQRYRRFVVDGEFDVLMVKAAQQWTFDAMWEILDEISYPKVLIPCGFSGLFLKDYIYYFHEIPKILRKFDHLIFYSSEYRDIEFCRKAGIKNFSVVPNAADEREFLHASDTNILRDLGLEEFDMVLLSVGAPPVQKGMRDLANEFVGVNLRGCTAALVLNSDWSQCSADEYDDGKMPLPPALSAGRFLAGKLRAILSKLYHEGIASAWKFASAFIRELRSRDTRQLKIGECVVLARKAGDRAIIPTSLKRPELVALYKHSDLFVFASWIEYSPLVLFEAIAAEVWFLSADVGNAEEISRISKWGGIISSEKDKNGFGRIQGKAFRRGVEEAIRIRIEEIDGSRIVRRPGKKFFWKDVAQLYLNIFEDVINKRKA